MELVPIHCRVRVPLTRFIRGGCGAARPAAQSSGGAQRPAEEIGRGAA